MEKLGGLTEKEKFYLKRSELSDSEISMMIGNATALYLRYKSIKEIEIDFEHECYYVDFNSFSLTLSNKNSFEGIYQELDKALITKAMGGLL